jgi:hypothetical protein
MKTVRAAGKAGMVFGGYAAAFLLAAAAFALRQWMTADNPGAQASSGMSAFGDSVVFVAVFGVAALAPTGLALYFLRPVRRFWTAASICALAVAATGVAASVLFWTTRAQPPRHSLLTLAADFSLVRVIVAPLLTAAFLTCAGFAPAPGPRRAFALAALCEGGAAAPWFLWGAYTILSK